MEKNKLNQTTFRIIIAGILIIAFFVGIIYMYYSMVHDEKRNGIIKDGRMAASRSADQFGRYLSTNVELIKFTAYTLDEMITEHKSDQDIQNFLVGQSTAVKNAVLENSTGLYGYINGRFFSGTNWIPPIDYEATKRPWYLKPMETPGELTILEPYVDLQSGNTMLALGKSLCDGDSVISVDVSLDQMQKLTEEAVADGGSDIEMILTGDGVVVTHSDINEVGKNYSEEADTLGARIVNGLYGKEDGYFEFEYQGKNYIVYDALFEGDWHCISVHDATSVFSSLSLILAVTVAVIVVTVLIIGNILVKLGKRSLIAQRAVAASEAKSEFLSNMSHELRTPINAVLGMDEMILRECCDNKILTYAVNIQEAGQKLLGFVDEILDYSMTGGERDKIPSGDQEGSSLQAPEVDVPQRKKFLAQTAEILVVDDNSMNLTVFKSLLKHTKVNIDMAGSGDEGLKLAGGKLYDIIFLDHMMPEKDGIVTLHELRGQKNNPNLQTPVICLTANAIAGAKEQYLAEGFDDYLSKPIDAGRLEETLLRYLPGEMIEFVEQEEAEDQAEDRAELPEELRALEGQDWINIGDGINNSGGLEEYMTLLKIFYKSLDEKAEELERLYVENDVKNYTIKVHALKSSARIIGAGQFGEEAQKLEDAGKSGDTVYIKECHEAFLSTYRSFKAPLAGVFETGEAAGDKPEADKELLRTTYEEIRSAADDMDCDRLQAIFKEMEDYRIPDSEARLWKELIKASDQYDYDGVLSLIDSAF